MIYLITAMLVSTIAMGLAGRTAAFGRLAWAATAVLSVAIIAGARNLDVAPDMMLYGNDMFGRITEVGSFDAALVAASAEVQDPEIGYVWLNFAVAQLSHDPHVFYFVLALLCGSIVAAAILLLRGHGPSWLMWLTYLCTAYLDSFNLLRQGPALALALLGVALVMRKRFIWGALIGLSGLLFHLTAIIFIPMWLAAAVIRRSKRPQRLVIWTIAATLAISLGASALLDLAGGVLSDTKYVYYLEETTHGGIALGFETLYRLVPLLLAIVLIRQALRHNRLESTEASAPWPGSTSTISGIAQPQLSTFGRLSKLQFQVTASTSVLIAMAALLSIELLILPIRELAFGLYRVPMYFGFTRILGYGIIVGAATKGRLPVKVAATVFVLGYFVLMVLGRTGIEYRSDLLDTWL